MSPSYPYNSIHFCYVIIRLLLYFAPIKKATIAGGFLSTNSGPLLSSTASRYTVWRSRTAPIEKPCAGFHLCLIRVQIVPIGPRRSRVT